MEDRDRRCSFLVRHASHSPVGPGLPPQAHLRCITLPRTDAKDGDLATFCVVRNLVSIISTLHRPSVHVAWKC
jgi:hypothetical protein